MIGGWFLPHAELVESYVRLTGRRVVQLSTPASLLLAFGRIADVLRTHLGVSFGMLSYESMLFASTGVPCDSSAMTHDFGIEFRPVDETMRDTLLWMHEKGLLKGEHMGALLPVR